MTIFKLDENTTCDPTNGILSCKTVPYEELDDDTLQMFYDYSKDNISWLMEYRPDWIKKYHPELLN